MTASDVFRPATSTDVDGLLALERAASKAALAHVFPPEQYPYPDDDVRDRWSRVVADDRVQVLLADDERGSVCLVAFDDDVLHHLAVRPDRWRCGWARAAVQEAVTRAGTRRLWCLRDNRRALGAYRRLGWAATGREQQAEFPPYPVEIELRREQST